MKTLIAVGIAFVLLGAGCTSPTKKSTEMNEATRTKACTSTKEYVTALEYLRSQDEFEVKEMVARDYADQVSQGCTGSAKRFVQIVNLLVKSNLGTRDALKTGLDLSRYPDEVTDSFISIFKGAFIREYLDLDLFSAMKLARKLSVEYKGNPAVAEKNFNQFVEFCLNTDGLNLSKPNCGILAARVIHIGVDFEKKVVEDFINLYRFLRSEKGPAILAPGALEMAEKTIQWGPKSVENFKQAFQFAVSEDGLKAAKAEAVLFAGRLSERSQQAIEGDSR